jgi:hypothetical protein
LIDGRLVSIILGSRKIAHDKLSSAKSILSRFVSNSNSVGIDPFKPLKDKSKLVKRNAALQAGTMVARGNHEHSLSIDSHPIEFSHDGPLVA